MDEIKSGSILKSVPEEMRPCPEIKSLETAKGNYSQRTIIHIVGSVRYAQTFKPPYQTEFIFYFIETMRGINRQPKKVIRVSQIEFVESESDDEDVSFIN